MDSKQNSWAVVLLLVASILLAISVIAGVGIETRPLAVFPDWQVALFIYGGPIMIVISIAAAATVFKWVRIGAPLAILSAILSILLSSVGIGLFGAPTIPTGVVVVDGIHLIVALAITYFAVIVWRQSSRKWVSAPSPKP
jgi:hypothetical protein